MEIWKDIINYEGIYQISNLGRVKSLERIVPYGAVASRKEREKILKPRHAGYSSREGIPYLSVALFKNKVRKQFSIHRLVAESFCDNSQNKPEVNHIDNNPSNNCANNLEWVTTQENIAHRHKQGRSSSAKGVDNPNSKISEEDVNQIRKLLNESKLSQQKIADMFSINQGTVSKIKLNKTYKNCSA